MRKVLGSLSLLVLLLNTLLTPITYAGEYEETVEIIGDNGTEDVVEENEEEEISSEFSVEEEISDEENEEENEEGEEIETEETEDDETTTGDVAEEGTGDIEEIETEGTEELTGENEELTGENEELTGEVEAEIGTGTIAEEGTGYAEGSTGDIEEFTGGVVEDEIGTGAIEEIEYNKESIIGEKTYNDVTVKVEALSGIFPEGTELKIEPIRWWNLSNLKDKLVEEQAEVKEDTTVVAFDITFIYSGEEVQPKEGEKVKVTFDYSKNEELVEADKQENQEVKVYHIEDKNEEGNELEKEEQKIVDVTNKEESEEEGIAVADVESFSVYAVVTTSGSPTSVQVTYDLNGGYWVEDNRSMEPKEITYTKVGNEYTTTTYYRTPSNTGFMFMGWYLTGLTIRRDGKVTDGLRVYAKWEPFDDLYTYLLIDESNIILKSIMDRNVGATDIYKGNNTNSYGYYFQWGNNYGFSDTRNPNWTNNLQVSRSKWSLGIASKYYSRDLRSNNDKSNWMDSTNNSAGLWGGTGDTVTMEGNSSTLEGRQGPCPEGYHVPSTVSWQQLFSDWNSIFNYEYANKQTTNIDNIKNGFGSFFLIPPAGRYQGSAPGAIGTDISYWASSEVVASKDTAHGFYVGQYGTQPTGVDETNNKGDAKSRSRPIRCFKNDNSSYLGNIELKGGTGGIISIAGGEVKSLKNPTRNSYTFNGWYTTSDFSGNPITIGSGLQKGDGLYAKWCPDSLNNGKNCIIITFDSDGGSDVPTQYITPGGTGTRPTDPEKDGYTFGGWYYTGLENEFDFETPITSDITIYAKWSLIEYTINYELNGGTVTEANPTTYTKESSAITLNNPTKDDYIFEGWSGTSLPECSTESTSSCEKNVTISQGSTGDRTYEAIWGYIKYDLIFDSLGGSEVASQRVIKGRTGTRPTDPEKDGYSFNGWYYTGLQTEFDFETPITSDITIYAKWSLIEYTINYELNGGSVSEANPTTYTKESSAITLNNPTKVEYVFEGWSGTSLPECSTESTSSCEKNVTISQGSTGDRTYEAIWGYIKYDLIFDSIGGSEVASQRVIKGRTGTRPTDPEKDGYTFGGWYYTGLENEFDFEEPIISNITVYAKWNLVDYHITYELNGGTGLTNTGIYTIETDSFTLNNPSKLNYEFIGWSGTNLSGCSVENQTTCNTTVTVEQGSVGNRVYEAIYDCAYGRKLDGTCNIAKGEDGLIDYENWEYNDLEVDLSVTDPVKIVIMDRNLGAAISDLDSTDAYGLYYQWGNNYGFRNVGTIENVSTGQVDASTYGPGNYYVSDIFILQDSSGWDAPVNYNLWGGTGDTTSKRGDGDDEARQGPCPSGYHVPSILEWHKLNSFADTWRNSENATDVCSEFNDNRQCVLSKFLKLPRAGNILGKDGSFQSYDGGYLGRYWSSSRHNDNRAYRYKVNGNWDIFQGSQNNTDNYSYYNSQGMSVRCFKNVSSKPIVYELSGGVQTSNQTSTVVWWNESAGKTLTIPTKTGFVFEGWYLTSGYEKGTRVTKNVISDYSDNESVILYANWKNPEYKTIIYNANGGYFSGGLLSTGIVFKEHTVSGNYMALTNVQFPNREGYMFDGWYLTGGETEWTGYVNNSTEEQTVYAKWLSFDDLTVTMSGITFTLMDRNLGATDFATGYTYGSDNEQNNQSRRGKYYQWGNNYGFSDSGNSSSSNKIDNTDNFGPGNYFSNAVYIWNGRLWGNAHHDLWGGQYQSSGDETRQGPCPVNYHVPTKDEWDRSLALFNVWKQTGEGITYCNSLVNSGDMYCFSAKLGLPFAGYLEGANNLREKGSFGTYWSSTNPYRLRLGNMRTETLSNGYGNSIRCFKDTQKRELIFDSKGGSKIDFMQTVRWWEATSSLPTPTRSNSTFTGWYTTSGYEEGTRVSVNYVPTESDSVRLYAKWECDGGYIESEDGTSCINNIAIITYNAQAHSGTINSQPTSGEYVEYDTVVTLPTKNIVSLKSGYNFIGWTTTLGGTEKIGNTYTVTGNVTFYPIFKKEGKQKDIKFYVNNNSGYIYNTVTYKEDKLFSGCTIPTLYNTDPYTGSCSVHITLPDIIAHENTQTVLGWSTGVNERTISYTAGAGVTITIPENKEVELYAQTRSEEKTYTATYTTDNRVEEVTETSNTCTIPVTYNGNPQQTVCTEAITLPNITAKNGYNTPVWKLGETEYNAGAQVYLSGNVIFTGTATPDEHTPYIVKHYYQTLSNTGVYELSGTDNLSGATENILTLSELQKEASSIPGFTYWNSRVNSGSDTSIDVTTINDFTNQGEIQPGLVIQLFYTRKNNPVTLNTIENAVVEKNPSKDNYYYGETIVFSGHAESGYTFSGWDIREGDAETGRREGNNIEYTMISTGVEVTPVIREHRYTIHYNASGAVGTMEDETVNYSEEVTLPTSGEVATHFTYTGHHFVGWTTGVAETTVITTLTKATPDDNGEITLYAKWEENDGVSYSVEYYLEPIEEGRPQSEYVLQTADTHHGTAPQGTTVTGTVKNYPGFTSPAAEAGIAESEGSLVIKYYYTRNSYDYTFAAGEGAEFSDGATSKTVSFRYEQSVVLPGGITLVKTGFTFSNWNPVLGPMPSEAKTSTAEWTENQYTINYNANGGEGTTPSQTVRYTDEVALTGNAFIKKGYVFTGWSKTTDGAVEYKDKALVSKLEATNNATVTLYAQWSAEKYIVTFDANSGEVIPTTIEVTYDATYGELPTPNRTGYTFQGWYTAKEGGTKVISSTQVKTANDHTLYAHWEVKMYTVTFNPTGGEVTPISIEVTYDEEYGELPIPTTTGYRFAGWYTDAAEPIQVTATTKVTIAANHTLKAHWLMNHYSIAFNANGGEGTMEKITDIAYTGSVILLANTFTREGYQFKGWSKTENGEKEFNDEQEVSKLTGENDVTVTLYAVWSINTYTITWKNSTGTVLKEEILPYGATPDYGGTPTSGADAQYTYTFAGWEPEIAPVTENQVYTATYNQTVNTYTIRFVDEDGTELYTSGVAYGTTPVYSGAEPTKENTAQYTYTFKGWTPTLAPVTGEATYTATYTGTINKYMITFVDEDGTELKAGEEYDYGTASGDIVQPAEPTKTGDAQYSYTFKGWTPTLTGVTEDQVYTATYSQTVNSYPITFYDEDGVTKIKGPTLYPYGTATGVIVPIGTPTKASDGTYTYEFDKWTPELKTVVGTADYRATYTGTYIDYLVTFLDSTGAVLTSGYYHSGETVTIPAGPAKASTAQTGYTFKSWYPEVKVVTGDITYEPTYTETTRSYTIIWNNRDGTELHRDEKQPYGKHLGYTGPVPTSGSTAQYTYAHNGWMPTVHNVIGPQVYTATYSQTTNSYPITWKNEDGTEIKTTQVLYGVTPSYTGPELTKEGYSFDKWTPDLEPVVGTASYTATYTVNNYNVTPVKGVGVANILGGGSYPYNTVVTLTGIAKEGYHFEGGVSEKAFTYTVPSHNITPQIDAEPNTYHVHFKPNGGTGVMANQEFVYDVEQELSPNAYTRSGFTFISWTDGEGGYYTDKKKVKNLATTGTVILLAQWFEGDGPTPPGPTPGPTPTPSGGGSSGGGGRRSVDKDTQEHASAEIETGDIKEIEETQAQTGATTQTGTTTQTETTEKKSTIQRTEEELTAYQYAYKYGITTLAPEEAAMPDAYVIRGHMAKMVVNYALNVLHRKLPAKMPKQCKWKDGRNAWESEEIKGYAEKACALGLMGIDMEYFQPYKLVTRAQFGTIFGRLLWGKVVSKPYYAGHLARLRKRGIMTQIDRPEERIEVRKWAWLMFMRSEKYFKVKK